MDDELISRAERAVLGAMIARPLTVIRLAHLKTTDFGSEEHRAVHAAIVTAQQRSPQDPRGGPGWREAIIRAGGPGVTRELLGSLERACPASAHGGTYAWLVVQGWASRRLGTLAEETAARLKQVAGEARRLRLGRVPEAAPAAETVRHIERVAQALRRQAAGAAPAQVHPMAVKNLSLGAARERQEEIVLAAFVGPWSYRAHQIAQLLAPEAIGDYYRRAVYATAREMRQAGRHVDKLTLDWQLAQLGLPLRYEPGGPTIGERLAQVVTGGEEPIEVARQLQKRYERTRGPRPLTPVEGNARPGLDPPRAQAAGGQPPLRLVQPPPGQQHGSPENRPNPRP